MVCFVLHSMVVAGFQNPQLLKAFLRGSLSLNFNGLVCIARGQNHKIPTVRTIKLKWLMTESSNQLPQWAKYNQNEMSATQIPPQESF